MQHGRRPRPILILTLALIATQVQAQLPGTPKNKGFDSTYVKDYSRQVTGRAYLSTKYNRMRLVGMRQAPAITYKPNNKFNIGVGASYRAITLNIGVGIPGLNKDHEKFGTTRYLDAQANIHTKRWATNLFLQGFRGYYISSYTKEQLGWTQASLYPTRPDIREYNFGVSTVHIFNNDKFSYRAAFNQDAWQRKSQGSFLAGGYITYFRLRSDSSLVPVRLAASFEPGLHLVRAGFTDLGLNFGYAYTVVVREHFFLTASTVLGAGISAQRATTVEQQRKDVRTAFGPGWHTQLRAATGYNSARFYIGISFNQENIGYLVDERDRFYWGVGNIRLNFAKRFSL